MAPKPSGTGMLSVKLTSGFRIHTSLLMFSVSGNVIENVRMGDLFIEALAGTDTLGGSEAIQDGHIAVHDDQLVEL